jgi:hypothetical protein
MSVPKLYHGSTLISPRLAATQVVNPRRTSSTDAAIVWTSVSPGVSNTKGAWVEVVASASADLDEILVVHRNSGVSAGANGMLLDVGTGGAGVESVQVADIALAYTTIANTIRVPIAIAAGTRLAVRAQTNRSSSSDLDVAIVSKRFRANTVRSPSSIDTLGADTSTSSGVAMSTSGTWVQVTAATSRAYRGVTACPTSRDNTMTNSTVAFDIGVGPGGSEVAAVADCWYVASTTETLQQYGGSTYIAVDIPAGSRVAARVVDAAPGNSAYSVVLLGVPA